MQFTAEIKAVGKIVSFIRHEAIVFQAEEFRYLISSEGKCREIIQSVEMKKDLSQSYFLTHVFDMDHDQKDRILREMGLQ